jgi:predicted Rossmann fold flavoprotein
VLERAERVGKKILISGGGRCNFTNTGTAAENYLSTVPSFCRSALARYTPADFLAMVERHGIAWHEKKLGQLFCDHSSRDIVEMLMAECGAAEVRVETGADVREIRRGVGGGFVVRAGDWEYSARAVVVAAGGLSWLKLGGSDVAYRVAREFGLRVVEPRPGLVPVTFDGELLELCEELAGLSVLCAVRAGAARAPVFHENLLFTHRGLSGPAILQASSYLDSNGGANGRSIMIDLLPGMASGENWLTDLHARREGTSLPRVLATRLPARLAEALARPLGEPRPLHQYPAKALAALQQELRQWTLVPNGTEGYPKAEVTLGGIDPRDLQSRTMESRAVPGLYFIGEAVDVTGHLGGFNFQWAWASGHAAGEAV